jgi:hypothetical protein
MRVAFLVALVLPFGCGAGDAQASTPPTRAESSVGPALVCDTPQELNRFVELVNAGRDAIDALDLVNREAKNPKACGNLLAAVEIGRTVAEVKMRGQLLSIVEVNVVGLSDGTKWTPFPPTRQYMIRSAPSEAL